MQLRDKNSKYFHIKASQRRRKNYISGIHDSEGQEWMDIENINKIFIDYFNVIFDSPNPDNMQASIDIVKDKIDQNKFEHLNQDFTAAEVSIAMKQMKSNAAPGLDGLPALFYQTYWDIVGSDVTNYVLNILNNKEDPSNINHTHLCLILKKNDPKIPADYRHIALCNVILKLVTKTIANRIKSILPSIISPQQSAFLPTRLITDNTLLAYEAFHYLKNIKKQEKRGGWYKV